MTNQELAYKIYAELALVKKPCDKLIGYEVVDKPKGKKKRSDIPECDHMYKNKFTEWCRGTNVYADYIDMYYHRPDGKYLRYVIIKTRLGKNPIGK